MSNGKPFKSLITPCPDDFNDVFLIFAREHNLVGNWIQFFVIMSKLRLNWAINCPHFLVILTNYLNFPRFVNGKPVNIPGHSVPLAGLGGFILVFGFLAFNGGSQVSFEFNFECHQFMWRAAYLKMETVALLPWQSWTQSWEAQPEALLCSSLPSSSGLPRTL